MIRNPFQSILLILVDFKMENIILDNSSAFSSKSVVILSAKYSESWSNLNQYLVSKLSLYAIEILEEKSAVEIAPFASAILAPIEVPERSNCLESTYSFFSVCNILETCTISNARAYDFSAKGLFFLFILKFLLYHLIIVHCLLLIDLIFILFHKSPPATIAFPHLYPAGIVKMAYCRGESVCAVQVFGKGF